MINVKPDLILKWVEQDAHHFLAFKTTLQKIVEFEKKATLEAEKLKPIILGMSGNERSAKLKASMLSYAAFMDNSFKMRQNYVGIALGGRVRCLIGSSMTK
jgi:hypothetical protein